MESYTISYYVWFIYYLSIMFSGPSILQYTSKFHTFLWLNNIPYVYIHFGYPFICRRTLPYFLPVIPPQPHNCHPLAASGPLFSFSCHNDLSKMNSKMLPGYIHCPYSPSPNLSHSELHRGAQFLEAFCVLRIASIYFSKLICFLPLHT